MNKTKGFLLILLLLCPFGCGSTPERHIVVSPEAEAETIPLISNQLLDMRIRFLTRLLEEESLSVKDRKIASNLLEAYKSLRRGSKGRLGEAEYRQILSSFFHHLSLVDENYFDKEKNGIHEYSEAMRLFANERDEIVDTYGSGDFKGVIKKCLKLKAEFGPDALTPEIALLFALSLAEEGMLEQAINIGEGVIHTMDTMPDLIHLRARMAELQLRAGKREKARLVYEKLTDTLDEQIAILKSLDKKIKEMPPTETKLETAIREKQPRPKEPYYAEKTEDEFFKQVENLVQEHRFGEAMDLLVSKRDEAQSGSQIEMLEQAIRRVELAEEKYIEEKIASISVREETLQLARKLLENEQIEEAISNLNSLEAQEEDSREIRELREQAIERLINRERNKAAKLFLAARNTEDPEKKEEYLRSSYEILKALIDKYPSSPLNEKLKDHIAKVTEELEKL
jgi:hypothetical protein